MWVILSLLTFEIKPDFRPVEGADGVFGLVPGVVLVLSSSHVQEAIHHSHTLVEALRWQLGQVAPGGTTVTRVPPQNLDTMTTCLSKVSGLTNCESGALTSRLRALSVRDGRPPMVSRVGWAPRTCVRLDCRVFCW